MNSIKGHIYLTGYRGSGKSVVGRWLATRLNRQAIDLDDRVESAAGMSIREIFASEGETGFRDRESIALQQVSEEPPSVIALGGGAILREENRRLIAATGFCIWLKADADTILERIKQDTTTATRRPSLTSLPARDEIISLLRAREPFYAAVANVDVDVVGKRVADIGEAILAKL